MEESQDLKKLFGFLQSFVYFTLFAEFAVFILYDTELLSIASILIERLEKIPIYNDIIYSKVFILVFIIIVSISTRSKKELNLNPVKHIFFPLVLGLLFFFGSLFFYFNDSHAQKGKHLLLLQDL